MVIFKDLPCCDLLDAATGLFCDQWGHDSIRALYSDGSLCPSTRWDCTYKRELRSSGAQKWWQAVEITVDGQTNSFWPYLVASIILVLLSIVFFQTAKRFGDGKLKPVDTPEKYEVWTLETYASMEDEQPIKAAISPSSESMFLKEEEDDARKVLAFACKRTCAR